MSAELIQEVGPARLAVDLENGARLASLQVYGHELLVTGAESPIDWGCYPMAPFAGRVRRGKFAFGGVDHQLPINMAPHAIHGTVFDKPWRADSETEFSTDLGSRWPYAGHVRHEVVLRAKSLTMTLEVSSDGGRMPASGGWHPWFRRRLAVGEPLALDFEAEFMERRDDDDIPTGERVPPPLGPWDDCFGGIKRWPVLTWPGALELRIESSCDYLTVYSERDHAVCVEPQTAPPNSLLFVVEPRRPLVATTTWNWQVA
ncbi:MAG: aldose 1-epimerase [Acidimicrobiia bacterium]|nr:aldose 1-epimerase [Acidimicrobiia bacterium]